MSAPTSRDPLVVNTKGGAVWQRRAVTAEGRGLYAVAGSCNCPEYLMATLAELAEHGITGSADALPMPVVPKPLELSEQQIEALAAAGNRVVNDATHEHLCMCDGWPEKCVSTGHYYMGAWDVSGLEDALPAVLALWEQMRGGELERLRVRVAELESERHSTNEALSKAMEAPRAGRGEADGITRRIAPTQALRADAEDVTPQVAKLRGLLAGQRAAVEDPHDGELAHKYRLGRDLPPLDGAR
jgi:hypothetical protein